LDAAVTTASLAVEEGESVQSMRFRRYVQDFQTNVGSYTNEPAVADFNELMRESFAADED
jgi:hypothetical protein